MGKKKKKKRKQKKKKYTKNQFVDIVCQQCDMCAAWDPHYCYEIAYLADPELFMKNVYTKLLQHKIRVEAGGGFDMMHFREVFCYSGLCGKGAKMSCPEGVTCFNSFVDQRMGVKVTDKRKFKRKKKHKDVYFHPYATFFISDDEEFRKEIEGILSDGDRDIEQDKNKRSAVSTG